MCWSVKANGQWCDGQGELQKALGGKLVFSLDWDDPAKGPYDGQWEGCLCPVDWEATAEKYGMKCVRLDGGDAEFIPHPRARQR